jgi:uncharacterized secreted protein with C-terminal beta-propeller domain
VLDFCDRSSLTLLFGAAAGDTLPDWVRERIAVNLDREHGAPGSRARFAGPSE